MEPETIGMMIWVHVTKLGRGEEPLALPPSAKLCIGEAQWLPLMVPPVASYLDPHHYVQHQMASIMLDKTDTESHDFL